MKLGGTAKEAIPYGAHVLCRGWQVSLADASIANATARSRPAWCGKRYEVGEHVMCDPVEGLGARDLHAIANGPLMDGNALYLPAGKLSKAEADARAAADVRVLP